MGGADKPLVPVIVGPTAVGKTAIVESLADLFPVAVVSADSRQIYRELDIGTAKPSVELRERVPHFGVNIVDPGEAYSAGRYARDAVDWLRDAAKAGQPLVVGGTGFYVRALVDGLFHEPPMDREARSRFRRWAHGADNLGAWAARLDRGYQGGGRQRAARTVEVALLTGRPLSEWQRAARAESVMRPWYVRLTAPREYLHARIERRARAMWARGWVDEVRGLLERGVPADAPGLDSLGYRDVMAHLRGELSEAETLDRVVVGTRRYAKRQGTWFRHQLLGHPVITVDATDPPTVIARRIAELWEARDE